ncbi:Crp/Fnr family transcriptional regulator [Echinicola strongylocentroti]|uniref:Crp/Fnr family transcriptional regulator n=1 Tax=Echinicola strongylocentroti TaxID=1795355 RepID=A0A2Z4IFE3_9BACT|nr:Crp/Fnr family transcriptional regulator [Echinicola strongylocentroti]AWW29407.1 Crp/Fnr family transcriptional regulator [Echinicola strongylocentroti]
MESINKFHEFLKSNAEFTDLDWEESHPFFNHRYLKKNEVWVENNKTCRHMAYIKKGLLRSSYFDSNGNEITSCFCVSNSMASSFKSFIAQTPSNIQIQAIEASELFIIDYDSLQKLYKLKPIWERIVRVQIEKEYISLWNYAHSLNSQQAQERYLNLLESQPEIVNKAPVQHIASYLGIKRETLSRIRKNLAQLPDLNPTGF